MSKFTVDVDGTEYQVTTSRGGYDNPNEDFVSVSRSGRYDPFAAGSGGSVSFAHPIGEDPRNARFYNIRTADGLVHPTTLEDAIRFAFAERDSRPHYGDDASYLRDLIRDGAGDDVRGMARELSRAYPDPEATFARFVRSLKL